MLRVIVGPALFLTCPMDIEKSQKWFGDLWNNTIVPYLSQINKEFTARVCISAVDPYAVCAVCNQTAEHNVFCFSLYSFLGSGILLLVCG